jgi:hypothetical protein
MLIHLKYEAPLWAGHLPLRVGEPAGGSLTADEYKFAVTGPWAIIVRQFYSAKLILKLFQDSDCLGEISP